MKSTAPSTASVKATSGDFRGAITEAWKDKGFSKMDWLGLESTLVSILKNSPSDSEQSLKLQLAWIREAIDAFTRRGHFLDMADEPYGSDLER